MEQAQFVNRFNVAVNSTGGEVQIKFSQNQPVWGDQKDEISGMTTTDICRLVMSITTAEALNRILADCLNDAGTSKTKE